MRRLSYCLFTLSDFAILVGIIIIITKKFVNCDDHGFYVSEFKSSYPAICDREYRGKYFNNEAHRSAVADGKLFVPPVINPEEISKMPNSAIYDNKIYETPASNQDDYAAQFLPIDLNPGPQYMSYGNNEGMEFMDEDDSSSQVKFKANKLTRPVTRNVTDFKTTERDERYIWSSRFDKSKRSIPVDKIGARLLTRLSELPRYSNIFIKFNEKKDNDKYLWSPRLMEQKQLFPREIISHSDNIPKKILSKISGSPVKSFIESNEFYNKKKDKYFHSSEFKNYYKSKIIPSDDRLYRRFLRPPMKNFNESYEFEKFILSEKYFPKFTKEYISKMKVTKSGVFSTGKSRKHNMRENHLKMKQNDEPIGFYKIEDTFGPLIDTRRAKKSDIAIVNGTIKSASQDKCKAMRRIVNGNDVQTPERLPYMVFVDTGCGGTIISNLWVLTAGHCLDMDDPAYVHVGSVTLMAGCQYNVVRVYIHPHYSRESLEFDVGLLKIDPPFVFSPAIKPIKMSSVRALRKMCGIVAGWGAAEFNGPPRIILSMTTIPVVARKKCRKFGIRKSQFCAGYDDGFSDACQGDSGGAFVVDGRLVGIVSYGYKCSLPHKPGVYVDVSYVRDWIRGITGF